MCFEVNYKAKPWRNRFVYKQVIPVGRKKGLNASKFDPNCHGGGKSPMYAINKTTRLPDNIKITGIGGQSMAGLYVFKTLKDAQESSLYCNGEVIIKCAVNPKDFIHSGARYYNVQATYRALKPVAVVHHKL